MNHLGDTNKMVDTPRTDAVQHDLINKDTYTSWLQMSQTARLLERELNAANDRIKRLESVENSHADVLKAIDNWMQQHKAKEDKL